MRRDAHRRTTHYRRLYETVGAPWHWTIATRGPTRSSPSHLARADIVVWECLVGDETAGFFELERHTDGAVEIAYFGLDDAVHRPRTRQSACSRAPSKKRGRSAPTRVWLHTCTLDSPHALPELQGARLSRRSNRETYVVQLHAHPSANAKDPGAEDESLAARRFASSPAPRRR